MFDSHFHLDESMVSLPGLIASMDAAGIERMALIPRMCPPLALPGLARVVLPFFRRAIHGEGPAHRLALALYRGAVKRDGTVDLLGKRYSILPQPPNDEVVSAVQRHPDRFVGYCFVNPAGPADPMREIARCMDKPGMIGVKTHPCWHDYPVSRLVDVARLCEQKGWPLLVHLGAGANGDHRLLPESFPRLKIIYAHAGIPYSAVIARYARERTNVHVDLSSSSYVDLRTAARTIRKAGAARSLFGTDGPYFHYAGDRFDFKPFLEQMARLGLSESERALVAGGNFRALAGLV